MKDPLSLLSGLLGHYSPTGKEAEASRYLASNMQSLGYHTEVDEAGNVLGSLGCGSRRLLLVGHIDTVPGEIQVRQEGDLLFGRGAVDAKGPLACFTIAAARLGVRQGWTITVVGAVGEEGNSRGAKFLRQHGPQADYLVIGEPSGWQQVILGYKGSVWLEFSIQQPETHLAGRNPSACDQAIKFLYGLDQLTLEHNNGQSMRFNQLTYSVREMASDQDGFSQSARLSINLRLPPGYQFADLEEQVKGLVEPGWVQVLDYTPAFRGEKNNPLVRAFLKAIRQWDGKPAFVMKSGTSDMNILAPEWGCPALAYGPGDSDLDHTPTEHISIQEYFKGIDVLVAALEQLTEDLDPNS